MREISWEAAIHDSNDHFTRGPLAGADNAFIGQLERWLGDTSEYPNVEGIILFINHQLDSSHRGEMSAMPYGKGHSISDIAAVKANPMRYFLNELPSMRQYPTYYITRAAYQRYKATEQSTNT